MPASRIAGFARDPSAPTGRAERGRDPRSWAASLAMPASRIAGFARDPSAPTGRAERGRDPRSWAASLAMPASRIGGFARDPSALTGRAQGVEAHAAGHCRRLSDRVSSLVDDADARARRLAARSLLPAPVRGSGERRYATLRGG